MKKETYVAPVMEIVLLEREKTVLTSECEGTYCFGVCIGEGCPEFCSSEAVCYRDRGCRVN